MKPYIARRLLIVAIVAGTILRFSGIESRSLWGDEIASLAFATGHSYFPWDEDTEIIRTAEHYRTLVSLAPDYFSQRLVSILAKDTQLPLYYTLLNLWLHLFGTSEVALRSFSAAASIASIPLIYALACALGSCGIGAYSALLFAVAPFQLAFAQYNRPYALLGFFALLSGLAAIKICREGGSWRWLLTYGGATTLGLYTHYLFIWNLPFHWILVSFYQRQGRSFLLRWVLLLGCVGGVFLPWVPVFLSQLHWNSESPSLTWFYWATGPFPLSSTVLHLGRNLVLLFSVGRVQGLCSSLQDQRCYADAVLTAMYYGIPILILSWCTWRVFLWVYRRSPESNHGLKFWSVCILWGFCVFAGVVIMDIALNSRSVRFPPYFIAGSGALYIAVATCFTLFNLRSRALWLPFVSLVFLLSGSVLYLKGFSPTLIYRQGIREVARHLDQSAIDDDLILVLNPGPNPIDLAYYLKSNPAFGMVNIPERWRSSLDISAQLEKLKRGRKRVWYLDDFGPEIRARSMVLTWLRTHEKEIEVKQFKNLDLFLFAIDVF
jgi:uncharacterized membrane protein